MTTLLLILAYAVSPIMAALAVILIQKRLRHTRRGAPPAKESEDREPKGDGD